MQRALDAPAKVNRYGGLCLGESTHLVDEVRRWRPHDPAWGYLLAPQPDGDLSLPLWPDHVGSRGTRWGQFRLEESKVEHPTTRKRLDHYHSAYARIMKDESDAHEPLLRVMALHALAYCERLFYLEEIEEIRLADEAVYAGRTLHEELKQVEEEDGEWSSVELASECLGLIGKTDALRRRDGHFIPYEHKRGRAMKKGKVPEAWPADILQVTAYAMLLEENSGKPVPEGRIRYHQDNVTVRVPLSDSTRTEVLAAVARARELRQSTERPPVTKHDRACIRCSLSPVCLPEEERLAADPEWDPIRLFPADKELKTIHVVEPSAWIGRSEEMLKIETGGEALTFPVHDVGAIVLHGYPQMTTQALHLCARHEIAVHWLSPGGYYVTGITPGAGPVQRRLRQYQALSNPGVCLGLAKRLVLAKVVTELRYLTRSARGRIPFGTRLYAGCERTENAAEADCPRGRYRCAAGTGRQRRPRLLWCNGQSDTSRG